MIFEHTVYIIISFFFGGFCHFTFSRITEQQQVRNGSDAVNDDLLLFSAIEIITR